MYAGLGVAELEPPGDFKEGNETPLLLEEGDENELSGEPNDGDIDHSDDPMGD